MKANGHSHVEPEPALPETKPIIVTKFEHQGEQFGCGDYAEGFFTRNDYFVFKVFFAAEPNEDTYRNTRLSEIYIETQDDKAPQWTWHSEHRGDPDWAYGKLLFADLLAGIDAAVKGQVANNAQYCAARVACCVDQLLSMGIDRAYVVAAMTEGFERARGGIEKRDRTGREGKAPAKKRRS